MTHRLIGLLVLAAVAQGCQVVAGYEDFEFGAAGSAGSGGESGAAGAAGSGAAGTGGGVGGTAGSGAAGTGGSGGTNTGDERACGQDSECAGGRVCLLGYCRQPCSSDTECPKTSVCLGTPEKGGCRLAGDQETGCKDSCVNPELFCGIDGTCRAPCSAEKTCPFNTQTCIQGTCVSSNEAGWETTWSLCLDRIAGSTSGFYCEGVALKACNVDAPGPVDLDSCKSPEQCLEGAKTGIKSCPDACPTDFRCVGAELQKCNVSETGYEKVATCASDPVCLKSLDANKGECLPPLCGEGSGKPANRCVDGDAESCDSGQQSYLTTACSDAQQCNPANGTCISFTIDETEVTRGAYKAFAAKAPNTSLPKACGWNLTYEPDQTCKQAAVPCVDGKKNGVEDASCDSYPQTCIDWCDAHDYCASLNKRLCGRLGTPGEMVPPDQGSNAGQSEWMNACSAGGQYDWVVGNSHNPVKCNNSLNLSPAQPQAVKIAADCVSPVPGYATAHDLSGNVAEWENSCDKAPDADDSELANCRARGGSYEDTNTGITCKASISLGRKQSSPTVGFRCCN
jgi:formylglycine-generating enzyme